MRGVTCIGVQLSGLGDSSPRRHRVIARRSPSVMRGAVESNRCRPGDSRLRHNRTGRRVVPVTLPLPRCKM